MGIKEISRGTPRPFGTPLLRGELFSLIIVAGVAISYYYTCIFGLKTENQ